MPDAAQTGKSPLQPKPPSMLGLSHVGRSPRWTMKGRYTSGRQQEGPGPGSYHLNVPETTSKFHSGAKHGFSTSTRGKDERYPAPGPADYFDGKEEEKEKPRKRGPAFSLTPRRPDRPSESMHKPGPGGYEIKSMFGEAPKYSTAFRCSSTPANSNPGPGHYQQADHVIATKSPRWVFGDSRAADAKSQWRPPPAVGPGTYTLGSSITEGPKFSMRNRPLPSRKPPSPGPGAHGGHYSSFN